MGPSEFHAEACLFFVIGDDSLENCLYEYSNTILQKHNIYTFCIEC